MTNPYLPRPAIKIPSGYVVFRSVQKRFPAFLRCHALHFLHESDFAYAELAASPLDFRNAVAKLSSNPILGPLTGGAPLIIYLAGRGLEADFKDLADEIQEEGLKRLADVPDNEHPILVIFGDPEAIEEQAINAPVISEQLSVISEQPSVISSHAQQSVIPLRSAPGTIVSNQQSTISLPPEPVAAAVQPQPTPPPQPEPPLSATPAQVETQPPPLALVQIETQPPPPAPQPAPPIIIPEPELAPIPAEPERTANRALPITNYESRITNHQPPTPNPQPLPPTALALGSDYYALHSADASGATAVVWLARRLPAPPQPGEYEILQPTAATYERLITEARSNTRYADEQSGELVAIRIALRGREPDLEKAFNLLRRLGARALRLYYPNPAVAEATWSANFPCYVAEWVSGLTLANNPTFSEVNGLEVCSQLLDLLSAARQAAPDIVLTDSLDPANLIVSYAGSSAAQVRLIDWNGYAAPDSESRRVMMRRLGLVLANLFAKHSFELEADPIILGAGQRGEPALAVWDALSYHTHTLIRRAVQNEFAGDIDSILGEMIQIVGEQRTRWADNDPWWQARLASGGPDRLNWLDITAVKQHGLSNEAQSRLAEARANELIDIIAAYTAEGNYYAAVIDLWVATRRHPQLAFFRWALLANTVALISPAGAFKRLRLDEALTLMSIEEYAQARRTLDYGVAFFNEVQFAAEKREQARDLVAALSMCAQCLALADTGATALNDNWNVQEAESQLALAEDRLKRSEQLAQGVLSGHDPLCQQKLETLRKAIADFYSQHGRYDPYAARRETAEQARRAGFNNLIERGRTLAATERPEAWGAALLLFDRAASEYPDLWQGELDRERTGVTERLARVKLAEGKAALAQGNWTGGAAALAAAMLCPAMLGEAARIQSALWAYQRGELEAQRGELSAALASFSFAAENSPELRPAAEARVQAVRELGGAPGDDAVSRELGRRFAEQQSMVQALVQQAVLAVQAEVAQRHTEALKQAQAEGAAQQAAAMQQFQAEQTARFQSALTQFQRESASQQEAATKKLQDEQLARLRSLLIQMYDEHAEGQRQVLKDLEKEQSARLRELQSATLDGFTQAQKEGRKAQEEQEAKLKAALKALEEAAVSLRSQSSQAAAKPEPTLKDKEPVVIADASAAEATAKELGWKVDSTTATLKTVQNRLGQLVVLNILLLLGILGTVVCVGGYALFPAFRSLIPLPASIASVASATAPAATPLAVSTTVTQVIVQPTQPSSPAAALACEEIDKAKSFYDCLATNTTGALQSFDLLISPQASDSHGFFYSVRVGNQNVQPLPQVGDPPPGAARFFLGDYIPGESRQIRITLSCTAAGGCQTTTFIFALFSAESSEPASQVQVTTSYSP